MSWIFTSGERAGGVRDIVSRAIVDISPATIGSKVQNTENSARMAVGVQGGTK